LEADPISQSRAVPSIDAPNVYEKGVEEDEVEYGLSTTKQWCQLEIVAE
jgi:hypothetical protein